MAVFNRKLTNRKTEQQAQGVTSVNLDLVQATSLNPDIVERDDGDLVGLILGDKYQLTSRLEVSSGEADIFLCEAQGKAYVAKIYRRESGIKSEIVEALKTIKSPYIAKIVDIGTIEGYPYEIMEYYKKGSLVGQTFSEAELKGRLIPQLNEALRALHSHSPKIIHKDLKPTNIMLKEDGDIALIDFGISSVAEDGSTIVATKTGMTPDYSAPEALRNAFLEESDYYSMGITIYELFTGHTPFYGMDAEQRAQYSILQKLPFPSDMPKGLQDLITGLTYSDLMHRHDKSNPNRRWTYEEVKNWCEGKKQLVPGVASLKMVIPAFTFEGNRYEDISELALAFAKSWEAGKKMLFRGLLAGFFMSFNPELSSYCMDVQDSGENEDTAFVKVLRKMSPDMQEFCWKGRVYEDLQGFGQDMLLKLRKKDMSDKALWDDLTENKVLSLYVSLDFPDDRAKADVLRSLESKLATSGKEKTELNYFTLAYLLSGDRSYVNGNTTFRTADDFADYMSSALDKSVDNLISEADRIIYSKNSVHPQFEAWLNAIGKSEALNQWKKETWSL